MTGIAPHFVEWVSNSSSRRLTNTAFDIYRDGLSIYTTIDSRMQRAANRAVNEHPLSTSQSSSANGTGRTTRTS
jgi:penicillin-binding protein 1A